MPPVPGAHESNDETKTTIDSLLELIKNNGKMELSKVSARIGVGPDIIESWSKVLEQGGLVKITYEVGKMYIAPITVNQEQVEMNEIQLDVKKDTLEQNLSAQIISLNEFSAAVDNLRISVSGAENIYKNKMPEIRKMFAEVNRIYETVDREGKEISSIKKEADTTYEEVTKNFAVLSPKIETMNPEQLEKTLGEAHARLKEAAKVVEESRAAMDNKRKEGEREFGEIKKGVKVQAAAIDREADKAAAEMRKKLLAYTKEINSATKEIGEKAAEFNSIIKSMEKVKARKSSIIAMLEREKTKLNDRYTKAMGEMEREEKIFMEDSKRIKSSIEELKANFGDAGSLADSVDKMKEELNQISKDISSTKAEVAKTFEEVKALETLRNITKMERKEFIDKASSNTEATSKKVNAIKGNITKTASRLKPPGAAKTAGKPENVGKG